VADAKSAGMGRMQCFSSTPAEAFYARHGFQRVDAVSIMLGDSVAFPAVLMERGLG
jgi:N-acetylglutamate synthase-like GNAT family acetyltransferase